MKKFNERQSQAVADLFPMCRDFVLDAMRKADSHFGIDYIAVCEDCTNRGFVLKADGIHLNERGDVINVKLDSDYREAFRDAVFLNHDLVDIAIAG